MNNLPQRKDIRIKTFDYSSNGAYFITICTKNRQPILWHTNKNLVSLSQIRLSDTGNVVAQEIEAFNSVYNGVSISKWCIMPDHIHIILELSAPQGHNSPSISRIINQFKGSVSRKVGTSVWQARYYDHIIRNHQDYQEVWQYIENNPLKYILKDDLY